MSKIQWHSEEFQDQRDRTAVITGTSSGIRMEVARTLAQKNATLFSP